MSVAGRKLLGQNVMQREHLSCTVLLLLKHKRGEGRLGECDIDKDRNV